MKPQLRAVVVAIAAWHTHKHHIQHVYDYDQSTYRRVNVDGTGDQVQCYDYDHGAHVNGSLPSLYHYGLGSHLQLTPEGDGRYSGYDYGSGSHFTVNVSGKSATLYDYDVGSHFQFQI